MEVSKICTTFGATTENKRDYKFQTKYGTLSVADLNDETFIPMMFSKGFDLILFLAETYDHTINKHSFKWNLHSTEKEFNKERLISRLTFLTKN
jgi:hypothetical protein